MRKKDGFSIEIKGQGKYKGTDRNRNVQAIMGVVCKHTLADDSADLPVPVHNAEVFLLGGIAKMDMINMTSELIHGIYKLLGEEEAEKLLKVATEYAREAYIDKPEGTA